MTAAPAPSASPDADPAPVLVPWPRVERFVGQFTHDVRNGLNALELQLTLLGEVSGNAEAINEVKAVRATLAEVTRQLQALKAASGPVYPHVLAYPATDFFEDLRDRFTQLQAEAAGRVSWKIMAGDAVLCIDPELLLSGLLELLANALYFGGSQAAIGLLVAKDERGRRGVTVTLREARPQPPGVSPADWGRTPLLTTRRNSYGLGLFRARRIIEMQGGSLTAEYVEANQVLTTTIVLPGAE